MADFRVNVNGREAFRKKISCLNTDESFEIKKSLVLQLFGGVKKIHFDGKRSRGDIHILLIGDPGVAKSVTLNFMANISPKGRYVVGKSTSGAGLTATVVRDEYLRGWSLEAGAMVLANRGLVCIDELEKMDPQDRSAMHEAMEQQTVTISKANVQACYSEDTEVLTEEGWKKYNEVNSLKIAQYDTEKKTIQFLPHKGLYLYDYKGKMYNFKDKRNDIFVTPNHTMLIRESRSKNFQKINAEDIKYNKMRQKGMRLWIFSLGFVILLSACAWASLYDELNNIKTKKTIYVEVKRQDGWVEGKERKAGRGNAHERSNKFFTPGLQRLLRERRRDKGCNSGILRLRGKIPYA